MLNSCLYLVSEDPQLIENCRRFAESFGVPVKVYSPSEWSRMQQGQGQTTLSHGSSPLEPGHNNVISFPAEGQGANRRVSTMNELESEAIRTAIFEFKGNLTEAAKALGIGRATLYRKVKQYNIDPSEARRKRVSAA